jgi:hypothetical protein
MVLSGNASRFSIENADDRGGCEHPYACYRCFTAMLLLSPLL